MPSHNDKGFITGNLALALGLAYVLQVHPSFYFWVVIGTHRFNPEKAPTEMVRRKKAKHSGPPACINSSII